MKSKINVNVDEIQAKLISDGIITNPDQAFEHLKPREGIFEDHSAIIVEIEQTEKEVQTLFDLFIRDSLPPFAPENRSIGRVKDAIYRFLIHEFPRMFEYGGVNGQMVVLYTKNQQAFLDVINQAKEIYTANVGKGKKELIVDEQWEVPSSDTYNNNYTAREVKLSILQPFYQANIASGPELVFVDYLESKSDQIEWWFKNGQRDRKFFAAQYIEDKQSMPFYPDWVVKYKDGRIGIFDTKEGITARLAKPKAEGLAKYLKEHNTKGKNLWGGIVIHKNGSWKLNDKEVYKYNEQDLSDWKFI